MAGLSGVEFVNEPYGVQARRVPILLLLSGRRAAPRARSPRDRRGEVLGGADDSVSAELRPKPAQHCGRSQAGCGA